MISEDTYLRIVTCLLSALSWKMVSKSKKDLSGIAVVIPMYNEQKGAEKCVSKVSPVVNNLKLRSKLIIVNDGSSDSTSKILNRFKNDFEYEIVNHTTNQGYGKALVSGADRAFKEGYKYVIFMDSDLTNHPKYIKTFAKHYQENWDLIKASRYIKGGKMKNVPLKRKMFSYMGQFVAANLFRIGIKDCTNGFRMVKTKKLQEMNFTENSFAIILEELYYLKKMGARVTEIPYTLTSRKTTKSSFTYSLSTIYNYLKYAFKASLVQ